MKILAIDTSTHFFSLSIFDQGRFYEYNIELARKQSILALPAIERVLAALKLKIDDFDYLACGLGPGSFTGVRIGVSMIKGLGLASRKPIIGVSSLDILAANAAGSDGYIMPVIDAKRRLVYSAIYQAKSGEIKRVSPYMLLSAEDLIEKAKAKSIILGDAVPLYKDKFILGIKGCRLLDKDYWRLSGSGMFYWIEKNIKQKKFFNAFNLKPVYLYPKECQVKK